MKSNQEIILQVSNSEVAAWACDLALDESLEFFLQEEEVNEPDPDKQHSAYSLDYVQVTSIVIQAIGVTSGLIAIYDKIAEIYDRHRKNLKQDLGRPIAPPVILTAGEKLTVGQTPRLRLFELDAQAKLVDQETPRKEVPQVRPAQPGKEEAT